MTLRNYVDVYAAEHETGIEDLSRKRLLYAVGAFEKFTGQPVTFEDLTPTLFNNFCDWTRKNRAPDTFRTTRGSILTLWKHAWENDRAPHSPTKIRKYRGKRRSPRAWTPTELLKLIATAESLDKEGWVIPGTTIPYGLYFSSMMRAAYDTAFRLGDLFGIAPGDIERTPDGYGVILIAANKTGNEIIREVRPVTLVMIDRCLANNPKRESIWPLWSCRETFYAHVKRLVKRADITTGTFRWIRRSSVTWCDITQDGSGTSLADHSSRRVTLESYLDQRQKQRQSISPPALEEADRIWRSRRRAS